MVKLNLLRSSNTQFKSMLIKLPNNYSFLVSGCYTYYITVCKIISKNLHNLTFFLNIKRTFFKHSGFICLYSFYSFIIPMPNLHPLTIVCFTYQNVYLNIIFAKFTYQNVCFTLTKIFICAKICAFLREYVAHRGEKRYSTFTPR